MRDLYEVLGVARTADPGTIRSAYRRLARQHHPDINPASAELFKDITVAYEVLSDGERRELYDEFGEVSLRPGFDPVLSRQIREGQRYGGGRQDAFSEFFGNLNNPSAGTSAGTRPYEGSSREPDPPSTGPGGSGQGTASGTRGYEGSPGAGDFGGFGSFGGTASGTRPYEGSPGERVYPGQYQNNNGFRHGTVSGTRPYEGSAGASRAEARNQGYYPGKRYGDGHGSVQEEPPPPPRDPRRGPPTPGVRPPETPRPAEESPYRTRMTGGPGFQASMPVPGSDIQLSLSITLMESLRGLSHEVTIRRTLKDGQIQEERLRISLRAGIRHGEELRMRGKGNHGQHGGPAGDLLLSVEVVSPPHFRREGHDLFIDVPITLQEAVVGGQIEVPTPDGPVRVRVPPGSINGRRLRLKRRGVSVGNGDRGDLYLILRPTPPLSDDPAVLRLLAELEKHYPPGGVRGAFEL